MTFIHKKAHNLDNKIQYIYDKVQQAYARNLAVDRPEMWIHLADYEETLAHAQQIAHRCEAGENLPLAGKIIAVKDNIDVARMPTTAACQSYQYYPSEDAHAVSLLRRAGAVVMGKTNLDQFATGLVGTRSPFGAVRGSVDARRIAGGSSSGSAIAVALGIVDYALGTDTAGSGRVPAALNNIFGIKPSLGVVSNRGVVPACKSIDCVTVFARTLSEVQLAYDHMIGYDAADSFSRNFPAHVTREFTLGYSGEKKNSYPIAIPFPEQLQGLAPGWIEAFYAYVDRVRTAGFQVEERDISPFLEAALLLYGPNFVAERYAAVGEFIQSHSELIGTDIDPTVANIIMGGQSARAWELFQAQYALRTLIRQGIENVQGTCAILTPTTTWHPTIDEVMADPIHANSRMGKYTNFCNLADFASIAAPAGWVDGLPFGVMFTGPTFSDYSLQEIVGKIGSAPIELFVVGAHRQGQVLNHELTRLGATFQRVVETSPTYRLYSLATIPPKPGLVRIPERVAHGIEGEVWALTPDAYAQFVAALPQPMCIGSVELATGEKVSGFLCEPAATVGAEDITHYKSWLQWIHRAL